MNLREISDLVKAGKARAVKPLVTQALEEGIDPKRIIEEGLLPGINEIGVLFRNNEVYVPEVLAAARAMNQGVALVKPALVEGDLEIKGVAVIGTVAGDLHDIGKNLVKLMMEAAGIEVIDLGVDVSAEKFLETARENKADLICCSTLLTTTMPEMKRVVEAVRDSDLAGRVHIMIGGAPVTQHFCDQIGADCYTQDAASAASAALAYCG